jgi:hypothetical protein
MKMEYPESGAPNFAAKPTDLAARVFNHRNFAPAWILFLVLLLVFVSFPIQRILLVFWAYGREGYFHQGIRVLPGKPVRFSNGILVPKEMDLLTGFGMFAVTVFGLSLALFYALRLYERFCGNRQG